MIHKQQLDEHSLLDMIFNDIKPTMVDIAERWKERNKETGKIRFTMRPYMDSKTEYCLDVFTKTGSLIDCVERLGISLIFLRSFPKPKTYEREGVDRYKWMEYHYSYFVLTLVSVYDVALLLVNSVFRLGLKEKSCNNDTVRNNEWIKTTETKQRLIELAEVIKQYRYARNVHVHRGDLPDINVKTDDDFLDMIRLIDKAGKISEPLVDEKIIADGYNLETLRIIRKLDEEVIVLEKVINDLFDSLLPIYIQERDKIAPE